MNKVVLDYLKANVEKYPVGFLRESILSQGYSLEEFNEAFSLVDGRDYLASVVVAPKPLLYSLERSGVRNISSDFKWMKLSSILEFIFLSIVILTTSLFFLKVDFSIIISLFLNNAVVYGAVLSFLLLVMVCLIGFIKLGKYSNSRILSVAAFFRILMCLVVLAVFTFIYFSQGKISTENLVGSNSGFVILILITAVIIYFIFALISSIKLLFIGDEVRFSKILGITATAFNLILIIGFIGFIYALISPMFFNIALLFISSNKLLLELIIPLIACLAFVLSRIFEPFLMIYSSRAYE